MTRERKAQALTVAVLAIALGIALLRGVRFTAAPPEPQDTIYAMLNAARSGDVKRYLAAYTGSMEEALRQSVSESYLRESTAGVKGTAVSDPEKISAAQVKIRVEYIYQDRNETQTIYLDETPAGWKISRTENQERVKTLIPYGTPVK
jgi:hypothetical protein